MDVKEAAKELAEKIGCPSEDYFIGVGLTEEGTNCIYIYSIEKKPCPLKDKEYKGFPLVYRRCSRPHAGPAYK